VAGKFGGSGHSGRGLDLIESFRIPDVFTVGICFPLTEYVPVVVAIEFTVNVSICLNLTLTVGFGFKYAIEQSVRVDFSYTVRFGVKFPVRNLRNIPWQTSHTATS
jgi:hypothetical protein